MYCTVEKSLAEVIKLWIASKIEMKPRLCCEIDSLTYRDAVQVVCSVVEDWAQDFLLLSGRLSGADITVISSMPEALSVISAMLADENVVTVANLAMIGGCTFDICVCEDDDTIAQVMAAAWGAHEESIAKMAQMREGALVFRGN